MPSNESLKPIIAIMTMRYGTEKSSASNCKNKNKLPKKRVRVIRLGNRKISLNVKEAL